MKVLLLYPLFPKSFWSFEKTLELLGRKAMLPPLGLVTVAAILPQEWEYKLVDRNVSEITEDIWQWADLVILSAMIVQKKDLLAQVQEAKKRGKLVAVGGPYPTALPLEAQGAGADFLILAFPCLLRRSHAAKKAALFGLLMAKNPMSATLRLPALTC